MAASAVSERTGIRERFVSHNGTRMFVREAGDPGAPTILLLHDLGRTGATFEPLMELLSDRYHLVAPDLVGFGRSDRPSHEEFGYHFPRVGCYVPSIVTDDLGIGSYAVYAQGSAGPVALGGFNELGDDITGMIMENPAWSTEGLRGLAEANAEGQPLPEAVKYMLSQYESKSWYYRDVWPHTLNSNDIDVLVLRGGRKAVVGQTNATEIRAFLPGAKTVRVDARHDVLAERTPQIAHEIDAFLTRVRSKAD